MEHSLTGLIRRCFKPAAVGTTFAVPMYPRFDTASDVDNFEKWKPVIKKILLVLGVAIIFGVVVFGIFTIISRYDSNVNEIESFQHFLNPAVLEAPPNGLVMHTSTDG
ncbi:hypothetical protein CAEBREN_16357 [Caenorhabditis brenneri]|uniref:Uncharacterized protein n=1 Tax=Caenorhabditis brenneri TaxID=135651 RepID=G0P2I6_CAEBE|nr:hypothetical protein CAEBREN_16357 [Caenorhabditis brenneri]